MDGRINPPSSLARWTPQTMAEEAARGFVIVGEEEGRLAACAFARPDGDALYLGKIAVDAARRRRGALREMIGIAAREARLSGWVALTLQTRIELTENHAAFAALGFEKTAETAHPGFNRPTSISMRKTLAPAHLAFAEASDDVRAAAFERIVRASPHLMAVLRAARDLELDDWWVVSGALYNAVWNRLTDREETYGIKDVDLFYWDSDTSWEAENAVIENAGQRFPTAPPVEIRNQARVPLWYADHFGHDYPQIASCREAIDLFACRAHCVGVRLEPNDGLTMYAPYGLADIFGFRLAPNLKLPNRATHEEKSSRQKALWPELAVEPWPEAP